MTGGRPGRPGRDPRLRPSAAGRRARPRRRVRARRAPDGAEARPAPARGEPGAPPEVGLARGSLLARSRRARVRELNLIIKADVQGSVEAAIGELEKIKQRRGRGPRHPHGRRRHHRVRHHARRRLARRSWSASTCGPTPRPAQLAEREGVDIRTYRVIYQLTEDIEKALVGMLEPETGRGGRWARPRCAPLFKRLAPRHDRRLHGHQRASSSAPRACALRARGRRRSGKARSPRCGASRTTCARSQQGFECGILLEGYNDVKEGDVIESFVTREIDRTDLDS